LGAIEWHRGQIERCLRVVPEHRFLPLVARGASYSDQMIGASFRSQKEQARQGFPRAAVLQMEHCHENNDPNLFSLVCVALDILRLPASHPSRSLIRKVLAGKVAIITGSSANLGRGYAVALAQMGADVVVHYHTERSRAEADETVRLAKEQGVRTILVSGDLTDLTVIKRMFDETFAAFGRVDIVINNAGAIVKKPLIEVTEEEFDRCFGINAKALFLSCRKQLGG
jgi:FlaA1/EpsC-like NDP-sugar epimerase